MGNASWREVKNDRRTAPDMTYPLFTSDYRYIGRYTIDDARCLFDGAVKRFGDRLCLSPGASQRTEGEGAMKALANDDGSVGCWDFAANVKTIAKAREESRRKSLGEAFYVWTMSLDETSNCHIWPDELYEGRAVVERGPVDLIDGDVFESDEMEAAESDPAPMPGVREILLGWPEGVVAQIERMVRRRGAGWLVKKALACDGGQAIWENLKSNRGDGVFLFDNSRSFRKAVVMAVANALAKSDAGGSDNLFFGPRLWAKDNEKTDDMAVRTICRAILENEAHLLLFDEDCAAVAAECGEPLSYLPYEVTLVAMPGRGQGWGVAATRGPDGIHIVTVGEGDLVEEGRNMLAFVAARCVGTIGEDGQIDYKEESSPVTRLPTWKGSRPVGLPKSTLHQISASRTPGSQLGGGWRRSGPTEPFVRREHMRRQHYGPGNSMVKIVIIKEALVGASKSGASRAEGSRTHRVSLRAMKV